MKNNFSPLIGAKYYQEKSLRLMEEYPSLDFSVNPVGISRVIPLLLEEVEPSEVTGRSDRDSSILYKAIKSRARWLAEEE